MPTKKKKKTNTKKKNTVPKKKTKPSSGFWQQITDEIRSFIGGTAMLVISVFFLASAFSYAGRVGDSVYAFLQGLLGVGYFLIPALFLFVAVSFYKNTEWTFTKVKTAGSLLFIISGLSIIDLVSEKAGSVGSFFAQIDNYFGFWMSLLIMIALFVVSMVLVMGSTGFLAVHRLFKRSKKEQTSPTTDSLEKEEQERIERDIKAQTKTEPDPEPETKEDKPKQRSLSITGIGSKKNKEEKEAEKMEKGLNKRSKEFFETGKKLLPPVNLLSKDKGKPGVGDIKANAQTIKRTFANFGINVEMDEVAIGPTVTRYSFKPAEGVKLSRIDALKDDLALALAAKTLRMEAPIPGKALVGVEIPNKTKTMVGLGGLLASKEFKETSFSLPIALGKDISGDAAIINLAKAPHMLIAGQTGAGKSVAIHGLINSLLYKHGPDMLKFIMVDPKHVELSFYDGIPHLLTPVITNAKQTILALKWAVKEMERRYEILKDNGFQNIDSYHSKVVATYSGDEENRPERMPYVVIVIDELADIMLAYPKELEAGIVALAQKSRAVGIHLILSTQRPSVNVITGLIKANVPTRVALKTSSAVDSRTILDMGGAEKLLGQGDSLYMTGGMSKPVRSQSAFISEDEVKKVVSFLKKAYKGELPDEIDLSPTAVADANLMFSGSVSDDDADDELYEEAKRHVIEAGKASTSYLQRRLRVGYARAARLMDLLEDRGVIGAADGSRPREILVSEGENLSEES